jgi:hypothetical protein
MTTIDLEEKNIYTIIGLITINFSRLEGLALDYISILSSGFPSVENRMICQDFTLEKKLQTIENLIKLKHNGPFEKLQLELVKRIKELKDDRNLFIHGFWEMQEFEDMDKTEFLAVKKFKYKLETPQNSVFTKIWNTGDTKKISKNGLIDYFKNLQKTEIELINVMNENVKYFSDKDTIK